MHIKRLSIPKMGEPTVGYELDLVHILPTAIAASRHRLPPSSFTGSVRAILAATLCKPSQTPRYTSHLDTPNRTLQVEDL